MKSKIKRKHFLDIIHAALDAVEVSDPASSALVAATVEVWESQDEGDATDDDMIDLGSTIIDLLAVLEDHLSDQIKTLEGELSDAKDENEELHQKIEQAIDILQP